MIRRSGCLLALLWICGSARAEVIVLGPDADTFINSQNANTPYSTDPNVQWDTEDLSLGGGVTQGLIWFDIDERVLSDFLADADATATFHYHVNNPGHSGQMHRMNVPWMEDADGVTFSDIEGGPGIVPGSNAAPDFVPIPGVPFGWHSVDVTGDLREWAAGTPNQGWGFLPTGDDGVKFFSMDAVEVSDLAPFLELEIPGGLSVPEPTTLLLLGAGVIGAGLVTMGRRRKG